MHINLSISSLLIYFVCKTEIWFFLIDFKETFIHGQYAYYTCRTIPQRHSTVWPRAWHNMVTDANILHVIYIYTLSFICSLMTFSILALHVTRPAHVLQADVHSLHSTNRAGSAYDDLSHSTYRHVLHSSNIYHSVLRWVSSACDETCHTLYQLCKLCRYILWS